ncbi:UNVERIFIED_CONTAM: hypothetical protein RMT77_010086 [Armadillidium vulgare]
MIGLLTKDINEYKSSKKISPQRHNRSYFILGVIIFLLVVYISLRNYRETAQSVDEHSEEMHPFLDFKRRFEEVCAVPRLLIPEYKGVESFFHYIMNPDNDYCYSWLEFGGEKIIIATQEEKNCMDEIRKTKLICFNQEYNMTKDPCLVYSFTKDADQQFERDMHMFSCYVHVFDSKQINEAEHVKRTEFWMEHAWDISEFPYDKPIFDKENSYNEGGIIRRRSLDYIVHTLKHEKKVINYIKSDHEGREWILLKNIIMHSDIVDVHQIGIRIHIPSSVNKMSGIGRHEFFRDLFQIFQGLSCLGYKYVMGRPAKYYKGVINIPEMEKKYFVSYELNFAKVLKS